MALPLGIAVSAGTLPHLRATEEKEQAKDTKKADQAHKHPMMDGHEVHKIPILVTEPLKPGKHELGDVEFEGIGKINVSVEVGKDGSIGNISVRWPKDVTP